MSMLEPKPTVTKTQEMINLAKYELKSNKSTKNYKIVKINLSDEISPELLKKRIKKKSTCKSKTKVNDVAGKTP